MPDSLMIEKSCVDGFEMMIGETDIYIYKYDNDIFEYILFTHI